eukprot:408989_1
MASLVELIYTVLVFIIHSQYVISSCPDYPPTIGLDSSAFKPILDQIDTYLSTQVSSNNIPGLISTIVYDQSQIFTKGYGSRDIFNASAPPPSGNDLVEVASITKIFTDLLLYYIRDNLPQHNLNLNDPITKYLPTFSIKNEYNSNPITLINLATQTSGLQRESPCAFSNQCNETQILQILSQRYLTLPPYTRFHYSNLGIALLGRSIEKLFCTYGCYEDKVKQLILNQLNFSIYSGFNYSKEIIDNYMAVGVAGYDSNNKPIKASVGTLGWDNPCGGLLANANDLSKLIMFMFRNNITMNDNKYQILNGSTIDEILKPKILLRNGFQSIGNPWEMEYFTFNTSRNTTIGVWYKGKEGELSGYRSSVVIVPQYKIGIFNSALISDVSASHVWAYDVLNMLIPYVDNLLYKNGNINNYILPNNYQLLIGSYRQKGYTFMVNISVVMNEQYGLKYLKSTDSGGDMLRLNIFENDKNVLRAYNLDGSECRWLDDGQDQELVYFSFDNGDDKHATSFIFMENEFVYV